jgi:DNA-binding transcriptional regulator LsrR (DeoR family)
VAAELFRDGHTVRQVADLLGVSRSEAGRLRLKAAADGIIGAVGEEDESEEVELPAERSSRLN